MSLRAIDISKETPRPAPAGDVPALEWVPVDRLRINEAYQRPIEHRGWKSIRKIADNFSWGRFSPLLVSRRTDGLYAVIDGQHRAHAAAMCGIREVPALVADLTDQEQAAAFSWVNGTVTALTPLQIYRAALAALEPWAVQCEAAVSRAGCRLMTWNASAAAKRPGEIYCIALIRKAVEADAAAHLIAVLEGLRASDCGEETLFYGVTHLGALLDAATDLGITRSDLIRGFLNQQSLWEIEGYVHKLRLRPEYRTTAFRKLYADSIRVMMKNWLKDQAA